MAGLRWLRRRGGTSRSSGSDAYVKLFNAQALEYLSQSESTEDLTDLRQALMYLGAAKTIATPGSDAMQTTLIHLGNAHYRCYEITGEKSDLDEALAQYESLAAETLPDDTLALLAFNRGNALHERAIRFDRAALEPAVESYRQAVSLTPAGVPERAARLSGLGTGLREVFQRTGRKSELDQCIEYQTQAVAEALASHDREGEARYRGNLGRALRQRALRYEKADDLDQAVEQQRLAITVSSRPSARTRSMQLHGLGNSLFARYRRDGTLDDLGAAIDRLSEALALIDPSFPHYGPLKASLGQMLAARAHESSRETWLQDLDEAIASLRAALDATPLGATDRPEFESTLGKVLLEQSVLRRNDADRRRALEHLRAAAESTDPESPAYAARLGDLGHFCHADYVLVSQDPDMLNAALSFYIGALAATPTHDTTRPEACLDVANALRDRYRASSDHLALEEALRYYREATESGLTIRPSVGVTAASLWGEWLAEREDWPTAAEAFSLGLESRQQLVALQASRKAKESWLRAGQHMSAEAAYVQAKLRDDRRAVLSVETGRALLLAEALDLARTDLSGLPAEYGQLHERFRIATERWSEVQSAADAARGTLIQESFDLEG